MSEGGSRVRRILAAMIVATSFISANAFAYDVLIYNCLKDYLNVTTYDDTDGAMMVPFSEYKLSPLSVSVIRCNGRNGCKIFVNLEEMSASFTTGGPLYIKTRYRGIFSVSSCDA